MFAAASSMIVRRLASLLSLSWKNEPWAGRSGGNLGVGDPAAVDVPEEVVLGPDRGVETLEGRARTRETDLGLGVIGVQASPGSKQDDECQTSSMSIFCSSRLLDLQQIIEAVLKHVFPNAATIHTTGLCAACPASANGSEYAREFE